MLRYRLALQELTGETLMGQPILSVRLYRQLGARARGRR